MLSEGIQQGIVPVLGVQDMSQARARWGEHETATMWSTPALRLVLAGVADPYTAQLVSDACGEQLVWRAQIAENTSTSHQVERYGRTYTGGDSHSYAQQRERQIQPADLRAMPAGRALALPQGREPITLDLFPGAPGLTDCDWPTLCARRPRAAMPSHSDGGGPPVNRAAVGSPALRELALQQLQAVVEQQLRAGVGALAPRRAASATRPARRAPRRARRSVHQSATSFEKTRG